MLSSRILVADLLNRSPLIAQLLFEMRVDCLGCSMNKFCTLEELCAQYELDLENVIYKVQEKLNIRTD
jgi:hypothetical protein